MKNAGPLKLSLSVSFTRDGRQDMNATFTPDNGIAIYSVKHKCSISLKVDLPNQILFIDCSGDVLPEPLASLPDSERLRGWKNLFKHTLNKVFVEEELLNHVWDQVDLSEPKRKEVRDWLISALIYTTTPLAPSGLKQAQA